MADISLSSSQEVLQRLKRLEAFCREVTENELAVEASSDALITSVRKVTKLEEKEIEAIQRDIDARASRGEIANLDCKKGCWFCCTQMVALTIPEVLRLADHIRKNWTEDEIVKLKQRMDGYMKATEAWHNGDHSKKPIYICPLLDQAEGACSVWTVRPLICRGYNSTDHNACIAKRDDPVNDPPIPHYVAQNFAATNSRTGLGAALAKRGLDAKLHEMIPALIIALEHPDAAERYLASEPLFAPSVVPESVLARKPAAI